MNWTLQAKTIFNVPKPAHFTEYQHCCECAEHDQTLLAFDVDSIGLDQLGHPSWDPLCFCSPEGFIYYMPALVRLALDTIDKEIYLEQLLFHLVKDGPGNEFVSECSKEQREFVAGFLEYLIETYADRIEAGIFYSDDLLKARDIWSGNNSCETGHDQTALPQD